MPNESISHCSMVVSACLRIIKKKKKKPWFGIHLIQHRLALKRHFHSLVFAFKTSASTLSSAATTSRVKLVQWSLLGVHGGNTKMERLLLPEVMCDKEQKPSRWLSQSHPLSWNVKHTCRHRNMCSHISFSSTFSFLSSSSLAVHLGAFTNSNTHLYDAEQMSES